MPIPLPTQELRQVAWQMIRAALQAVDPAAAVKNYFTTHPEVARQITATAGRVLVEARARPARPWPRPWLKFLAIELTLDR